MGPQEDHVDPQNWGDDNQLFPLRLQTIDTYILNQGLTRYSQTSSFNHERCAFRKNILDPPTRPHCCNVGKEWYSEIAKGLELYS